MIYYAVTCSDLSTIEIYVGEDGKLHFIDSTGADTVLNFSTSKTITLSLNLYHNYGSIRSQAKVYCNGVMIFDESLGGTSNASKTYTNTITV